MGNWFGKKRRGLLLGVWNAHTSVGNILGTVVPAIWAVSGKPWSVYFLYAVCICNGVNEVPGKPICVLGLNIRVIVYVVCDSAIAPQKKCVSIEYECVLVFRYTIQTPQAIG